MIELKKGIAIALPLVKSKAKHQDYDRVVELCEKYYRPMSTGVGIDHLIKRFNRREDEEMHRQRILLTQVITPAITNTIMGPVRKIPKVKPNVSKAVYPKDKEKTDMLAKAVANFYAGKNIDHYIGSVLLDQGALDPNAFCLISFENFDARYEKPRIYPTLIACCDAWNFEYFNGELQWLMVHRDIEYEEVQLQPKGKKGDPVPPVKRKGNWFCLYTDINHVMFTQVDPKTVGGSTEGVLMDASGTPITGFEKGDTKPTVTFDKAGAYYYRPTKDELYEVVFFEHSSGVVQSFRLGYRPDAVTNGRTMVNLWHSAMPYLLKGIKAGSELDLTAALHAFLQKLQYSNPCKGYTDENKNHYGCVNGDEEGGQRKCRKCGGSGWDVITTAQDHMTFRLPRTKEEFLDLAQFVHYVQLPVEVLNWQDGYVDKLAKLAYEAVFNSEPMSRDQVQPTATGELRDDRNLYDTLQPGCDWYSQSWILIHRLVATYIVGSNSINDLQSDHVLPRDLNFASLDYYLTLLGKLKDNGGSAAQMIQTLRNTNMRIFVDDPNALKRADAMLEFDPFAGKDRADVITLILQDLTPKEDAVYWTNMNKVWNLAISRTAKDGLDFLDFTREKQQEVIDDIVQEIMDKLADPVEQVMKIIPRANPATPTDPNMPAPVGAMPPSPGNNGAAG